MIHVSTRNRLPNAPGSGIAVSDAYVPEWASACQVPVIVEEALMSQEGRRRPELDRTVMPGYDPSENYIG